MTFTKDQARQACMDAIGTHPASVAMLATAMHNAGCEASKMYFWARIAIAELVGEKRAETVTLSNGDVIYRLPANTPSEPKKAQP